MSELELSELLKKIGDLGDRANEPSEEQLRTLLSLNRGDAFCFVNLLKYRTNAVYPNEHSFSQSALSGRSAYEIYGRAALDHVTKRGGRLEFASSVEMQLIGSGGDWDAIATMRYPSLNAFINMISDPTYQKELVHRDAGLLNSEVYVTRPVISKPVGRLTLLIARLFDKRFK